MSNKNRLDLIEFCKLFSSCSLDLSLICRSCMISGNSKTFFSTILLGRSLSVSKRSSLWLYLGDFHSCEFRAIFHCCVPGLRVAVFAGLLMPIKACQHTCLLITGHRARAFLHSKSFLLGNTEIWKSFSCKKQVACKPFDHGHFNQS